MTFPEPNPNSPFPHLTEATGAHAEAMRQRLVDERMIRGPTITMSVEDWHKVPTHPRQRNTVQRAERARHLTTPLPRHADVAMCILPNGEWQKIDGHTRDLKWTEGSLAPPPHCVVDVYYVADQDASNLLYATYDSQFAVETMQDRMYGAQRYLDLDFKSPFMKAGRGGSAVEMANMLVYGRADDTYTNMMHWQGELVLLDAIGPSQQNFILPVVTGSLLCLRRWPTKAYEFLTNYQARAGNKTAGACDAVEALHDRLGKLRADGATGGGMGKRTLMVRLVVVACEGYIRNRIYQMSLKDMQPNPWLAFVTKVKSLPPLPPDMSIPPKKGDAAQAKTSSIFDTGKEDEGHDEA